MEKRFAHTLERSVMDEIQRVRMDTVRSLVAKTDHSFSAIAKRCGFTILITSACFSAETAA
jgi:transcriptional regulator GlxA family with amidase domain